MTFPISLSGSACALLLSPQRVAQKRSFRLVDKTGFLRDKICCKVCIDMKTVSGKGVGKSFACLIVHRRWLGFFLKLFWPTLIQNG